jgi:hypothetical protein
MSFLNLVNKATKLGGKVTSAGNPIGMAVGTGAAVVNKLLPSGGLKDFFAKSMTGPVGALEAVAGLFKHRKYTRGDYWLVRTYKRYLLGEGPAASDIPESQITDDEVVVARSVLIALFGVPIGSNDDIVAMDSVNHYYDRDPRQGYRQTVPIDAVQRAVFLRTKYYTDAAQSWDYRIAEGIPVAGYTVKAPTISTAPSAELTQIGTKSGGLSTIEDPYVLPPVSVVTKKNPVSVLKKNYTWIVGVGLGVLLLLVLLGKKLFSRKRNPYRR